MAVIQLETNPLKFTAMQWLNVIVFAATSLAAAAWWQTYVSIDHVAIITGVIAWFTGIINFVSSGATKLSTTTTKTYSTKIDS